MQDKKSMIHNLKSGIYTAIDEDSKELIIMLDQHKGMTISAPTHNGWREVVHYDSAGEVEGITYEK